MNILMQATKKDEYYKQYMFNVHEFFHADIERAILNHENRYFIIMELE